MALLLKVFTSLTQAMTASDLHTLMVESKLSSYTVYQMFAAYIPVVFVDLKRRRRKNEVKFSILLCLSNLTTEEHLILMVSNCEITKLLF